jgi:O-antigen/teichoic acid export membrane protein
LNGFTLNCIDFFNSQSLLIIFAQILFALNRKFIVNIFFLLLLNLIVKPFWFFGIEVKVQNTVGNANYGLYASLLSFSIIFNFLLDLGVTNFNNREIARNQILLEKYFSHILVIKFLFGLLYAVVCLFGATLAGYGKQEISLLSILVFNQFLSSLILYLRSNINALLMFVTDSILSVLDKFLMIIFLSFILWSNLFPIRMSIQLFVYAQTVSYLITAAVAGWIVLRHCSYFHPRFDKRYIAVIIRKSLPFTLLVLLMGLYNRLEPIFLERLLSNGKLQAGLYAQGYRILEVLSNFALLFSVLLLPLFSKMLKNKENISSLLEIASPMLIIPAVSAALCISFYANDWINLLYHNTAGGKIFSVLILGFPGICLTYIYGTLLTANGSFRQLNTMAALAVVMNISLNLFLIPRFFALGASFSSFITQIVTGIIQYVLAIRILKINVPSKRLFYIIFWLGCSLLCLFFLHQVNLLWIYKFLISLFMCFLFALLFGLIRPASWVGLFRMSFLNFRSNKDNS